MLVSLNASFIAIMLCLLRRCLLGCGFLGSRLLGGLVFLGGRSCGLLRLNRVVLGKKLLQTLNLLVLGGNLVVLVVDGGNEAVDFLVFSTTIEVVDTRNEVTRMFM